MVQQIRGSQFIFTYGPGSIIEGVNGPRIIPRSDIGLFAHTLSPDDYEISDPRMSIGLLDCANIYRLPSNAELNQRESFEVYKTKPFPRWRLCLNKQGHGGDFYILHQDFRCPSCGNYATGYKKKGSEPVRFVKACSAGHIDEVNWNFLAHGNDSSCNNRSKFNWYGGGGSLAKVKIECPICHRSSISLGKAYGMDWKCTGRSPELEDSSDYHTDSCDRNARIIQRQASNLRIPQLLTLFAVYPRHTLLHNLLQNRSIYDGLISNQGAQKTQSEFNNMLTRFAEAKRITKSIVSEISSYSWKEVQTAILDIMKPIPKSYYELIQEEFKCLTKGSIDGIPPIRGPAPKSPVLIEINPKLSFPFKGPNGTNIRVTPVSTLTTVTVQKGYRREVYTKSLPKRETAKLVDVSFSDRIDREKRWYPGVQYLGEGIFLMFDGSELNLKGQITESWMTAFNESKTYPEYVFRDEKHREELHPAFVWWHTLSHLLIREISFEAGYSSSSIRERIYLDQEDKKKGGVLLYTTQPGSEGTLGGLTSLVPHFQDILNCAFNQLQVCSSDPLCIENKFKVGDYNGSVCYGCLLLSETCCDHRNMWLDRNILMENLP